MINVMDLIKIMIYHIYIYTYSIYSNSNTIKWYNIYAHYVDYALSLYSYSILFAPGAHAQFSLCVPVAHFDPYEEISGRRVRCHVGVRPTWGDLIQSCPRLDDLQSEGAAAILAKVEALCERLDALMVDGKRGSRAKQAHERLQ